MVNPNIYAIQEDGKLLWHHHPGASTGSGHWEAPREIGTEWHKFKKVFSGGSGVIYAIAENNDLLWYRHEGYQDGSNRWDGPKTVGSGWDFEHVFCGANGDIYAIEHLSMDIRTGRPSGGHLLCYKHLGITDGSYQWAETKKFGSWNFSTNKVKQVFSGEEGIIYSIRENGDLFFHKNRDYHTGGSIWDTPKKVGNGWSFEHVFSNGEGVIYAVEHSNIDLRTGRRVGGHTQWYHHLDFLDGTDQWEGPKQQVGISSRGYVKFKNVFSGGVDISLAREKQIAADKINDFHWRTGKNFGPLGIATGSLNRTNDGSYVQNYQLGVISLANFTAPPLAYKSIQGLLALSAVKCFGTEDPGGNDQTYLIITVTSLNPNFGGVEKLVYTSRTNIQDNVEGGNIIFQNHTLQNIPDITGSGLKIHVAVFEHEYGDADQIRDKIQQIIEEAAIRGASALAAGAAGADAKLAGPVGDLIDFEIAGIKPFKIITFGIADLITGMFADDLVDEHEFFIPTANIMEWAQKEDENFPKWQASLRTNGALTPNITYNIPIRPEDEILFEGGGGSYKVYFKFTPKVVWIPIEAKL